MGGLREEGKYSRRPERGLGGEGGKIVVGWDRATAGRGQIKEMTAKGVSTPVEGWAVSRRDSLMAPPLLSSAPQKRKQGGEVAGIWRWMVAREEGARCGAGDQSGPSFPVHHAHEQDQGCQTTFNGYLTTLIHTHQATFPPFWYCATLTFSSTYVVRTLYVSPSQMWVGRAC